MYDEQVNEYLKHHLLEKEEKEEKPTHENCPEDECEMDEDGNCAKCWDEKPA